MEETHTIGERQVAVRVSPELAAHEPVKWAIGHLLNALEHREPSLGAGETLSVRVLGPDDSETFNLLGDHNIEFPASPEAFALLQDGESGVVAIGSDVRGTVYALTELADRARYGTEGGVWRALPIVESTKVGIRSMGRLFTSDVEDREWFYDKQGWRDYLDMLVTHRYNRFSLGLALGYNFPYHNGWITEVYMYFPYPFLLDVPGHSVSVNGLSEQERESNLDIVRFIGEEVARRGLEYQLALWTQRYAFDDVPRASHTFSGVEDLDHADYCKRAVGLLLTECPEITGLTLRVHVEGGVAEGDYGFWEGIFNSVKACGRPINIDMHAKGIDHQIIDLARIAGGDVSVSPKYMAEHMGLPYHQADIRDKEIPDPGEKSEGMSKFSSGARKFLRYSYGDLLQTDRKFKVLHRIWAGTQRFLLWADPVLAGGYSRGASFCGSDGVERWEPMTFKGRMGTGVAAQRHPYKDQTLNTRNDWERYEYEFRVWGRKLYSPDTERDGWFRYLKTQCGDAADLSEQTLSWASRILPLITTTHGPSAANNHYWPEIYTNLGLLEGTGKQAYGFDMTGPVRFGNAPPFDPKMFATAREFVTALHSGKTLGKYSPLDVSDWLKSLYRECEKSRLALQDTADFMAPMVQRIHRETGILSGMAKYFAYKFEAACWMELHLLTEESTSFEKAFALLTRAVDGWRQAATIGEQNFPYDITFGPQRWLRGSWQERLPEIEAELWELEGARFSMQRTIHADRQTRSTIEKLDGWRPAVAGRLTLDAPETFEPGKPITITASGADGESDVELHYRHVNHAERWVVVPMSKRNGTLEAQIPASYTDANFHLQYFVASHADGALSISPGLAPDLANDPYGIILRDA